MSVRPDDALDGALRNTRGLAQREKQCTRAPDEADGTRAVTPRRPPQARGLPGVEAARFAGVYPTTSAGGVAPLAGGACHMGTAAGACGFCW